MKKKKKRRIDLLRYTKFKFCPRCGKADVAGHQKKAICCQSCGYVYFHNCASAAAAIIETPKGIILTKRADEPKKGFYDLPGGFVDYLESLEEALSREIKEELDMEIRNLRYLGSFPNAYSYQEVTYFTTDAIFIAQIPNLDGLKPGKEIDRLVIAEPRKIDLDLIAFDSIKEGIKSYLKCLKCP